jgi:hypothetical protein
MSSKLNCFYRNSVYTANLQKFKSGKFYSERILCIIAFSVGLNVPFIFFQIKSNCFPACRMSFLLGEIGAKISYCSQEIRNK